MVLLLGRHKKSVFNSDRELARGQNKDDIKVHIGEPISFTEINYRTSYEHLFIGIEITQIPLTY